MAIEDKKLDQGLFSGIKNVINEIMNFIDESRKYQSQFDAIKNVGKQKKTKEELDLMLQLCAEMKRQSKSKYMKRLLYKFIEELEMQKDGEQGLAAGMIGPTQLKKINKRISIITFISFFVLWIAFDFFIAFVVVIIFAVCAGIYVSKIEAKNKRIRRETQTVDLITAACEGQTETVKLLIDKGADIEAKNKDGLTVLMCAASMGQTETIELLLDKGADIEAKNKDKANGTALMCAAIMGQTETIELLLDKGADIDAKDNDVWTALMFAISEGHTETVALLLDKGADTSIITSEGETALSAAEKKGHTEIVKYLKKYATQNKGNDPKEEKVSAIN